MRSALNPTLLYGALGAAVFASVLTDNLFAAVAWAVAMFLALLNDMAMKRVLYNMYVASLFINAYDSKWPNEKAQNEAAEAAAKFKAGK